MKWLRKWWLEARAYFSFKWLWQLCTFNAEISTLFISGVSFSWLNTMFLSPQAANTMSIYTRLVFTTTERCLWKILRDNSEQKKELFETPAQFFEQILNISKYSLIWLCPYLLSPCVFFCNTWQRWIQLQHRTNVCKSAESMISMTNVTVKAVKGCWNGYRGQHRSGNPPYILSYIATSVPE